MEKNRISTKTITRVGVLAAMSIALSFLETGLFLPNLPLLPGFLQLDISDLPALLGAFAFGPLAGLFIETVKNAIHLFKTTTGGVGELANLAIGAAFVMTAGAMYRIRKNRLSAYLGMFVGTLAMIGVACLSNAYVLLPLYAKLGFTLDVIVGMTRAIGNTLVTDLGTYLLYVVVPFNLVKGLLVSVLTGLVYKRVSPLLHGVHATRK
jgi:riboflavin transporter FmnP